MKVQITGITSNQVNIMRPKNPLFSAARALLDGLNSIDGVEAVNSKEDVNPDVLFYGLYALNSFVSGGFIQTSQRLAEAAMRDKKIVFFVDDWHLDGIGKSIKACYDNPEGYWRFGKKLLGRDPSHMEQIGVRASLSIIQESDAPVMVHVLPWLLDDEECRHDYARALCVDEDRVILYDPTSLIQWGIRKQIGKQKDRAWVLSSRYDFRKQVGKLMQNTWPIKVFGCKKVEGATIVPNEVDLVEAAYMPNWGVISHPYPSNLQGQWRNRFVFSEATGSVVAAFGREKRNMHTFYSVQDIEAMNDANLAELAHAQSVEMNQKIRPLIARETLMHTLGM
jgi:hypothetical protein